MRAIELGPPHLVHDVGGQEIRGAPLTRGRLLRGGFTTPYAPSAVGLLRAQGLTAVLDLRSDREAGKVPQTLAAQPDMSYRRLPIGDEASRPQPGRCASLAELYLRHLERHGRALAEAVTFVLEPREGAVLVHCRTGRDRTGLVVALTLGLAGARPQDIVAHHARAAESVAPTVARRRASWLAKGKDIGFFDAMNSGAVPAMEQALSWISREHGDIAGYLTAHGAPGSLPERAVRQLLPPATDAAPRGGARH
ncbi:tyrosine-protein phosphatase [Streptomyces sp. G-5]|uniref:tyrosine-protein phosphatase n=1 Tax=Streptomyces sp. G-5 TaxID=2977231 RepID=UPI0021CE3ABA|nr:tyrosine-protein phosphatase [Streptomyces sp. G-5]MCU4749950.1 tyrosine-protein phosphatase [Streptomyces sp. G-5]